MSDAHDGDDVLGDLDLGLGGDPVLAFAQLVPYNPLDDLVDRIRDGQVQRIDRAEADLLLRQRARVPRDVIPRRKVANYVRVDPLPCIFFVPPANRENADPPYDEGPGWGHSHRGTSSGSLKDDNNGEVFRSNVHHLEGVLKQCSKVEGRPDVPVWTFYLVYLPGHPRFGAQAQPNSGRAPQAGIHYKYLDPKVKLICAFQETTRAHVESPKKTLKAPAEGGASGSDDLREVVKRLLNEVNQLKSDSQELKTKVRKLEEERGSRDAADLQEPPVVPEENSSAVALETDIDDARSEDDTCSTMSNAQMSTASMETELRSLEIKEDHVSKLHLLAQRRKWKELQYEFHTHPTNQQMFLATVTVTHPAGSILQARFAGPGYVLGKVDAKQEAARVALEALEGK